MIELFRLAEQPIRCIRSVVSITVFAAAVSCCSPFVLAFEDSEPVLDRGRKIYSQHCTVCHGDAGKGQTDRYSDRLIGDLNIAELTELISDTMPEEDPELCVGDDAKAVATYIYNEFYSANAQYRINRPQTMLSRRTVRQYRESVADLLGHFANRRPQIPRKRGLNAEYYAFRSQRGGQRLAKQVDSRIDFSEQTGGVPYFRADDQYENVPPVKQETDFGRGFSAYWKGGVIAPKTGHYEIVVECANGFKVWLNNDQQPLIDRWVKGDQKIHRASIYLLGGRAYGLYAEMFAFKEPTAAIVIKWKPPGSREEVIPAKAFIPFKPDEVAVVDTPFPPDDGSFGFERGISVSKEWDEATTSAAVSVADWVADRIWKLADTKPDKPDHSNRIEEFCQRFVERAFIDRLNNDERQFFVDQHFDNSLALLDQVRRVVILTLKSPRFLYPDLQERNQQFAQAGIMANVLWDSVPDRKLFVSAMKNELTDQRFNEELERMTIDPRSREKMRSFFRYWLKTNEAAQVTKDDSAFPGFDDSLMKSLNDSLEQFLDDVVWSEGSNFRELFLADYLYVNKSIAEFYGFELTSGEQESAEDTDQFHRLQVDPDFRAGILTHPFLMAGLAYHKESSPIHRGVFIARSLLGRRLRQPPEDVEPLTEEFNPTMTTRERVEHQTRDTACMSCHSVINPLGFSLENYDAVGRLRLEEKQKPIDVTTIYETPDGQAVNLKGARELANYLADNQAAQKSFINQVFQYYTKQPAEAYGKNTIGELHSKFVANEFQIQTLLGDITQVVLDHDMRKLRERDQSIE